MINIFIIDKNVEYSVKLLNSFSNSNSNVRIANIANSVEEIYNLINNFKIGLTLL